MLEIKITLEQYRFFQSEIGTPKTNVLELIRVDYQLLMNHFQPFIKFSICIKPNYAIL